MNLVTAVLRNTSAQVVSRLISSGSGFLITILIARYLGIGGYSDVAKITALVSLFYLGIDLGANAIFLQFEKQEQKFQQLLLFRLLISLFLIAVVAVITFFLPFNSVSTVGYSPLVKIGIIFFSFSILSRAVVYSCSAVFQQTLTYVNATKASAVGSLLTLLLIIAAVALRLPLLWIIAGYVIGGFFEAGISLFLVGQATQIEMPSLSFFKRLLIATLPLTVLLILNLLYFRVDMVLLAFFQRSTAVGVYDFAYKFFDFLIALPLFLSNSLYPHLVSTEKNSRIQRKNISLYTMLFFMLGLLFIPVVWLLSPLLSFVKQDFAASVMPLRLLALSLPIFFATNILQWIFITKKKQIFLVVLYAVSLLLTVVLNIIFIPMYSYVASAVITDISEGLILLAMMCYAFFL